MIYTPLTKKAMQLCFDAHKDQKDKSGLPYVFHPFHLAEQMDDEIACAAALLHDVMEDAGYTPEALLSMGFPAEVVDAVTLLTHPKGMSYMDYVARIRPNSIARKVKIADLRHNSDLTRLDQVEERDRARAEKYARAISLLESGTGLADPSDPNKLLLRLLNTQWANEIPVLRQFQLSTQFWSFLLALGALRTEILYCSRIHGLGHIERTMLLGGMLSWKESLSIEDSVLLQYACGYHDIGRVCDGRDREHGFVAARRLRSSEFDAVFSFLSKEDRRILCAMVSVHCLSDAMIPAFAEEYGMTSSEAVRYERLTKLLKDADGLDRVRLGDLDGARLRSDAARELVPFACVLYEKYCEEQKEKR